jgi:MFS family permease
MARQLSFAGLSRTGPAREIPSMPFRAQLDWLNFFLADVKGGLGPYIGIYLLTEQHWNQAAIGFLATVAGIVGLVVQAPLGAFIDATYFKRGAIVVGVAILSVSAFAIAATPSFPVVLIAQTAMAVAGSIFGPAIAAITLGILGSHGLAYRIGRNAAFDHAGNVSIAVLAGAVGWRFSQSAVFYLVPIFSVLAASAVLSIPAHAINHSKARGLDQSQPSSGEHPSGWSVLITCKPLLVFAVCVALFHFANAPMLALVGQKLALAHKGEETAVAARRSFSRHSLSCRFAACFTHSRMIALGWSRCNFLTASVLEYSASSRRSSWPTSCAAPVATM